MSIKIKINLLLQKGFSNNMFLIITIVTHRESKHSFIIHFRLVTHFRIVNIKNNLK